MMKPGALRDTEEATDEPVVVQNWSQELLERVPVP